METGLIWGWRSQAQWLAGETDGQHQVRSRSPAALTQASLWMANLPLGTVKSHGDRHCVKNKTRKTLESYLVLLIYPLLSQKRT